MWLYPYLCLTERGKIKAEDVRRNFNSSFRNVPTLIAGLIAVSDGTPILSVVLPHSSVLECELVT